MRHPRLLLSTTLLALGLAVPLQAQPTVEELDVRMRAMETSLQSILDILQAQQGGAGTTAGASTVPADKAPTRYSGLIVGVCPMDLTRDGKVPNACEGLAAATAQVKVPNVYAFDDAMNVAALTNFTKVGDDQALLMAWRGELIVDKAGPHSFQVVLSTTGKTAGAVRGGCYAKVVLNGQDIARAAGGISWTGDQPNYTDQGEIELTPGPYDYEVLLACSFNLHVDFHLRQISAQVAFAEPGDSAFRAIPSEQLVLPE